MSFKDKLIEFGFINDTVFEHPEADMTEDDRHRTSADRYARAGYEGYARFTGGKTFDGRPMPAFDGLEQRIKDAWAAASFAILAEHETAGGGAVYLAIRGGGT